MFPFRWKREKMWWNFHNPWTMLWLNSSNPGRKRHPKVCCHFLLFLKCAKENYIAKGWGSKYHNTAQLAVVLCYNTSGLLSYPNCESVCCKIPNISNNFTPSLPLPNSCTFSLLLSWKCRNWVRKKYNVSSQSKNSSYYNSSKHTIVQKKTVCDVFNYSTLDWFGLCFMSKHN